MSKQAANGLGCSRFGSTMVPRLKLMFREKSSSQMVACAGLRSGALGLWLGSAWCLKPSLSLISRELHHIGKKTS